MASFVTQNLEFFAKSIQYSLFYTCTFQFLHIIFEKHEETEWNWQYKRWVSNRFLGTNYQFNTKGQIRNEKAEEHLMEQWSGFNVLVQFNCLQKQ